MTEPLIVDPDRLASASSALGAAASQIPVVTPYAPAVGTDPLSVAIAQGASEIEFPMQALPGIKRVATETATNVGAAGKMYADTDQEAAENAARLRFASPGSSGLGDGGVPAASGAGASAGGAGAGIGSGVGAGAASGLGSGAGVAGAAASASGVPGAGQAGGLSQMMGAPMQMAQQAGQIPQQLAQMAGSAPQGVMQGAQGAVQQVTQMAGQFGKPSGDDARGTDVPVDRDPARDDRPEDRSADTVL